MGLHKSETLGLESEEQKLLILSKAIENNPASIVITSRDGNIVYVNPKFVTLTGYSVEEVIGQNPSVLQSGLTPPEIFKDLWRALSAGKEWRGIFTNKKKNGELYTEEALISPITNEEGVITHYVAVKEDITARLEAERKKEMYQKELELFSSLLRHDLTNDAQIILVNIGLLQNLKERTIYESKENLEIMNSALTRMINLLKMIKEPIGDADQEFITMLETVCEECKSVSSNLEISINTTPEIRGLRIGRAAFLPVVFTNLIRNSVSYCGSHPIVKISLAINGPNLEIDVTDNGPGVPETIREKLFQKGVSTSGGGYGLYLSKAIMRIYNSSIDLVQTPESKGATFRLIIPLSMF